MDRRTKMRSLLAAIAVWSVVKVAHGDGLPSAGKLGYLAGYFAAIAETMNGSEFCLEEQPPGSWAKAVQGRSVDKEVRVAEVKAFFAASSGCKPTRAGALKNRF